MLFTASSSARRLPRAAPSRFDDAVACAVIHYHARCDSYAARYLMLMLLLCAEALLRWCALCAVEIFFDNDPRSMTRLIETDSATRYELLCYVYALARRVYARWRRARACAPFAFRCLIRYATRRFFFYRYYASRFMIAVSAATYA